MQRLLILLSVLAFTTNAQQPPKANFFDIIFTDSILWYSKINDSLHVGALKGKYTPYPIIVINDTVLHSQDQKKFIDHRVIENKVICRSQDNTLAGISSLGIDQLQLGILPNEHIEADLSNYFLVSSTSVRKINFSSASLSNLLNIRDLPCNATCELETLENIAALSGSKYLITTCVNSEENVGCDDIKQYLFDRKSNEGIDISSQITSKLANHCLSPTRLKLIAISDGHIRLLSYGSGRCTSEEISSWVVDDNFNTYHQVLTLGTQSKFYFSSPNNVGYNYSNNILNYIYLQSSVRNKSVMVPYKFIPTLDIAMYKAYHNEALTDEDVAGLGGDEIRLLRSLLFAKHNYHFDDKYLEAYFNLYSFYNDELMVTQRKSLAEIILTESDHANLDLLKKFE